MIFAAQAEHGTYVKHVKKPATEMTENVVSFVAVAAALLCCLVVLSLASGCSSGSGGRGKSFADALNKAANPKIGEPMDLLHQRTLDVLDSNSKWGPGNVTREYDPITAGVRTEEFVLSDGSRLIYYGAPTASGQGFELQKAEVAR